MIARATCLLAAAAGLAGLAGASAAQAQPSPSPYTSATRYDAMGRVTGTIAPDPDGAGPLRHAATRTTYDMAGRPVRVEIGELSGWKSEALAPASWTGFTIHTILDTSYDLMGRKLTDRISGKQGAVVTAVGLTQYSYDAVGRLECTAVRMNPASWASLPASACALGTQGSHGPDRITRNIYDAAGQLLQVREEVGTAIEAAEVTYSYTLNGQKKFVIDANGNRAELRYDGHDRLSRWVFPSKTRPSAYNDATPATALSSAGALNESDYEAYTHDANSNRLTLRKRDGTVLGYQYDALNRVTRKTVPERADLNIAHTRDVLYNYDLRGLQTAAVFEATDDPGVFSTWDGLGRLTGTLATTGSTDFAVSYEYDANGNRTRITYPDGAWFAYEHDGLNRVSALKDQSGAALLSPVYNTRGLPSSIDRPGTAQDNAFGYDPAGRLQSLGIAYGTSPANVNWTFTRNPASQLASETRDNDAYAWDGHVNIDRAYGVNGLNQYTAAGSAAFCHDANGNLTADGSSVYLYDIENRLAERRVQINSDCNALSYAGALEAELRYDPLGRMMVMRDHAGSNGTTRFAYDGDAMIAEYGAGGTFLRRYVHGSNAAADDPLIWYEGASVASSNARHLHADPRGSIVLVVDANGGVIAINTYDEYGIPGINQGRFQYTGQAWLEELGMYYYKARIYSPTLGRFLQTDPIGYEDQWNLYAYVANDPINMVDPDGTCAGPLILPCAIAVEEVIVIGAAAAAAACVAYCPSAEQVKEAIDQVIDKITPDPVPEIGPAPAPRGGTKSEAKSKKPPKRAGDSNRKGHDKGARGSTRPRHEGGDATGRKDRDGEKGDNNRRPPRKPPGGKTPKGGWPPKKLKDL